MTVAAEAVGVDLGGTKLAVGVVDADMRIVHRNVIPSQVGGRDELVELLVAELREALAARPGAAAVGLGVPCTIDRASGVCVNSVHLPLKGFPLRDAVREQLGVPVFLDNDANVAALAESRAGVGRGADNLVMLTLGTGIGGGLVLGGRLYRGSHGAGAELGHMVVQADGPACHGSCPNHGCIECFASGTALARAALDAAERAPDSGLGRMRADGAVLDGKAVTVAARAGDEVALAIFDRMGRMLGAALSGLANAFDPDVIVLGGGVMDAGDLLLEPARRELRERALPPQNEVELRAAELGQDAGLIGAAVLAREELEEGSWQAA